MSEQILISHSSKDNDSAQRIKKVLEDNGFSCWLDNDNIPPGADFVSKIAEAMRNCEVVVVLVSKNSQDSDWVRNEVTAANSQKKLVIPYMIQDFEPNDTFKLCLGNAQRVSGFGDKEEDALRRVVTALRDYLNEAANGEEIKITIEKHPAKKKKTLLYAIIGLGVLAAVLGIVISSMGKGGTYTKEALEVYYSEVLPYEKAGYFNTVQEGEVVSSSLKADKAFSILSFIRNQGDKAAFVEQISCDILKLEKNEDPVLVGDVMTRHNHMRVFVYNDGWGAGKNAAYTASIINTADYPMDSVKKALEGKGTFTVEGGDVSLIMDVDLPTEELKKYAKDNNIEFTMGIGTLKLEFSCGKARSGIEATLVYEPKTDILEVYYGGQGDGVDYSITLYALLDVDQNPSSIRFTGEEATPLVDNTFRIETVIIPTKSCYLECKGVYSIAGDRHETEVYKVTVTVPVFREGTIRREGAVTKELFEMDMRDTISVRNILGSYRYDPQTVIEYAK
ncbi:MAG: toll/interleukin-1 receptor domain-containing protein [Firmicutes bacterium]|nr:toll/interleukin-1 receptor domain-containing protein [Bacillota bacterium]